MQRPYNLPVDYEQIQVVSTKAEAMAGEFSPRVNAYYLPRELEGDFNALAFHLCKHFEIAHGDRKDLSYAEVLSVRESLQPGSPMMVALENIILDFEQFSVDGPSDQQELRVEYGSEKSESDYIHADTMRGRGFCAYTETTTKFVKNQDVREYPEADDLSKRFKLNEGADTFSVGRFDFMRFAGYGAYEEEALPFLHWSINSGDPENPPKLLLVSNHI